MSKLIDTLLARVVLHEESDQQFLFLRERGGTRGFPIVIGNHEAFEIQRLLNRQATERPLTHQLLHACLEALGAKLEHVEVTALRGPTFYANLVLRPAGAKEFLRVDARPSDAIALALRAGCPCGSPRRSWPWPAAPRAPRTGTGMGTGTKMGMGAQEKATPRAPDGRGKLRRGPRSGASLAGPGPKHRTGAGNRGAR
jgi:uncharacterized protein